MKRALCTLTLLLAAAAAAGFGREDIDSQIAAHPAQTGALVLERGEQSLLVRAWLADHARKSIDVQYFIWSVDNIGTLAAEALLRAAERGVQVRVIVDDLLLEAPEETLIALAAHPRIDIRIYNPMHSVGVPWYRRLLGVVRSFRGSNQRMHDKTLIVDGQMAITGGRNMADEYYDYDHAYNFRDRDALVLGKAAREVQGSFERFHGVLSLFQLLLELRQLGRIRRGGLAQRARLDFHPLHQGLPALEVFVGFAHHALGSALGFHEGRELLQEGLACALQLGHGCAGRFACLGERVVGLGDLIPRPLHAIHERLQGGRPCCTMGE